MCIRDSLNAVRIDQVTDDGHFAGAVMWIEILDPLSKPGGPNCKRYQAQYELPAAIWLPLVEIDYAHHSGPMFGKIPSYPDQEGSYPYRIHVWPDRHEHKPVTVYQFGVDVAFPIIDIPLGTNAILPDFNLDEAYNLTFRQNPAYWGWVDYARLPLDFDSFSVEDQQRIRNRMRCLAEAALLEVDLDNNAPFLIGG